MKKRLINFLFCILLLNNCFAQTEGYHFYSNFDTVKTSGFYNIVLTPQINAHVKTDYSDVRIINDKNRWVPHIFHVPLNEMSREVVTTNLKFSVAESNKLSTIIIIDAAHQLNNINVLIKNTAVQKFGTLSGSNNKQNWFLIRDSILLTPHATEKNTESILNINFPQINYSYLKLVINNRNKDPFSVGEVDTKETSTGFLYSNFSDSIIKNPAVILMQKDSGKQSFIKIIQTKKFHFTQINIKAEGLKYYNREVDLYVAEDNNSNFLNPGKFIQSFIISNNSTLPFNLPLQNANIFYLIIKNEDNPALKIKEATTGIGYRYITAYLEKNNTYKIILDNIKAVAPNYDITKDYPTIKDTVSLLSIGNIFAYENKEVTKNNSTNKKTWLIWLTVIVTLIVLLFLTITMLKEVNKKR